MYIYFPHIGERVNLKKNKDVDTMDDMGRSMPRIYATLDNK